MTNNLQDQAVYAVQESISKIIRTVEELSEEVVRWNPSEEEWSIMQIMTHVAEALPYWMGEINRIIDNPNETWGRGLKDEVRLQTVSDGNINRLSVKEVIEDLQSAGKQVETLRNLTNEQLALTAPSRNPRFEGKNVEFIVKHLIVDHVENHYGQIQRNLSKWTAK